MKEEVKKQRGHNLLHKNDKDLPGLKFKYLCDFMGNRQGKTLEIGCGSGKNLRSLYNYNKHLDLYGVDIDNDAICEAKKHYNDFIHFSCSPGEHTSFENGYFDYIIISDYLEHVDDANLAINEIHRILKLGGYVHAFVPCEGEKFGIYRIFKKLFGFNVKKTGGHVQFFTKNNVEKLFLMGGFDICEKKYSYHFFGKLMDFLRFTLLLNKRIAKFRWQNNKYYNEVKKTKTSAFSIILNALLSIANFIAYIESSLLKHVRFGAAGIHLVLKKVK